jgi:two-component system, cell cycle response regulator CtrA
MNLIVHSSSSKVAIKVGVAATLAGAEVEFMASPQDLVSRLYRDPEAIGLLYVDGWMMAVEIVSAVRETGVRNILFCLVELFDRAPKRASDALARILNAGADDAQPWPVDPREVAARVSALARRTHEQDPLIAIPPAGLFNPREQKVYGDGIVIHLTGRETALLEFLASRAGSHASKKACMLAVYGERDEPQSKILDVFICKLRKKLAPICGDYEPIETIWGQGYRFNAAKGSAAA